MRLQIAILSLVFLAGCSEWDRHRPQIAPEPVVQRPESIFAKICEAIEKLEPLPKGIKPTYGVLFRAAGKPEDCTQAAQRISAIRVLDLSGEAPLVDDLDLRLIAELENLETLILRGQVIDSVVPLAKLSRLAVLDVSETGINQDLFQLDVHKLPLENYRRLRVSVESLTSLDNDETVQHLTSRFKKSLRDDEILVRAMIERGTQTQGIPLESDATKNAALIKLWQTGAKFPTSAPLGSFYDPRQITEANPYIVFNRGYTLDFHKMKSDRDPTAARLPLLREFAEHLFGNTWTYPNEGHTRPFDIVIQPTNPVVTPEGRSGAVLKADATKGAK